MEDQDEGDVTTHTSTIAPTAATSPTPPKVKPTSSAATASAAKTTVSSKAGIASTDPSAIANTAGVATGGSGGLKGLPIGSVGSGLVALKRSVSPSTTSHSNTSREGHLLSIGSVLPSSSTSTAAGVGVPPDSPAPRSASAAAELNVRGSLTLLKTKTAGSRRRRSVADIEGAQDEPIATVPAVSLNIDPARSSIEGNSSAADAAEDQSSDQAVQTRRPLTSTTTSRLTRTPSATTAATALPVAVPISSLTSRNAAAVAHVSLDLNSYTDEMQQHNQHEDENEDYQEDDHDDGDGDYQDPSGGGTSSGEVYLKQCPQCTRKFNPLPFEKHVKVCSQVFMRKRKAFDSAKMRVEANPDLQSFLESEGKGPGGKLNRKGKSQGGSAKGAPVQPPTTTNKWKEESEAFRAAMKAARDLAAAIAKGGPLPPPVASAPNSSLVPCPHCDRRFSAKAAERHIPSCQNIIAKPSSLRRGGGGNASKGMSAAGSTGGSNGSNGSSNANAKPGSRSWQ